LTPSLPQSEISATTKVVLSSRQPVGGIAKIIESWRILGKTLEAQNPDSPVIVKWQQLEQFKLQASNSLTARKSQSD